MCLWALGDFAMTYEGLHNANPPTPVLANYLWAAFFPVAYVGVMVLMRQEVRKFSAANYLDGVVATLTCAAAFAAFAFGDDPEGGRRRCGDRGLEPDLSGRRHPAFDPDAGRGDAPTGRPPAHALVPDGRRQPVSTRSATSAPCSATASAPPTSATSGTPRPGRPRCSCSRCRSGCPRGRLRASSRRPARAS